jgi:glyoxylase-like metal-dependent hydrolase (beta-lactamase superfamily II)
VAVFLIRAGGDKWLVDAGAGTSDSVEALRRALAGELGSSSGTPRAILSHSHLDHAGGVAALSPERVIAHRDAVDAFEADERTPAGVPFETVEGERGALPGVPAWEWLLGEGHAPGHLLLWQSETRTLLAGDQFMLGLKTPLRVADPEEDSLGAYMRSLERIAALEPSVMLPSHTRAIEDPCGWLDREVRRLSRQLERALVAVRSGAQTAEEVTANTYGTLPGAGIRHLLLREKLAALRHLAMAGAIRRDFRDGQEVFES